LAASALLPSLSTTPSSAPSTAPPSTSPIPGALPSVHPTPAPSDHSHWHVLCDWAQDHCRCYIPSRPKSIPSHFHQLHSTPDLWSIGVQLRVCRTSSPSFGFTWVFTRWRITECFPICLFNCLSTGTCDYAFLLSFMFASPCFLICLLTYYYILLLSPSAVMLSGNENIGL
jgi:hypothetical protein